MFRYYRGMRLVTVGAVMLAWLAGTNHCLLATPVAHQKSVAGENRMASDCPMHAKEQHSPQPQKQNGCGDLPCCKNLQATTLSSPDLDTRPLWLGMLVAYFTPPADQGNAAAKHGAISLDTGPPGESSFAELVLQRSILAHAPPVSLS